MEEEGCETWRRGGRWCDLEHAGVIRAKQSGELVAGDCKVIYVFRDICDVCYSLFFYFPALFQVIPAALLARRRSYSGC